MLRHRRLKATNPPAGARLATPLNRKMRNRPRLRPRPIVRLPPRSERRVHHVPHEHVQHAANATGPPEQHLPMQQRPRVPIHMHRQPRALSQTLPQRHERPPKPRMVHHHPRLRINPPSRRHTNPQRPALAPIRRVQRRKTPPRSRHNSPRLRRLVQTPMTRQHPSAQVKQCSSSPLHRDMHPRNKVLRHIDINRNMRTPSPVRPHLIRQLPQQTKPSQLRTMPSNRRRRKPRNPRNSATSDRPMLKHHPQHRTRTSSTSPTIRNPAINPTVASARVARTGGGVGRAGHEEVSARAAAGRIGGRVSGDDRCGWIIARRG